MEYNVMTRYVIKELTEDGRMIKVSEFSDVLGKDTMYDNRRAAELALVNWLDYDDIYCAPKYTIVEVYGRE